MSAKCEHHWKHEKRVPIVWPSTCTKASTGCGWKPFFDGDAERKRTLYDMFAIAFAASRSCKTEIPIRSNVHHHLQTPANSNITQLHNAEDFFLRSPWQTEIHLCCAIWSQGVRTECATEHRNSMWNALHVNTSRQRGMSIQYRCCQCKFHNWWFVVDKCWKLNRLRSRECRFLLYILQSSDIWYSAEESREPIT